MSGIKMLFSKYSYFHLDVITDKLKK